MSRETSASRRLCSTSMCVLIALHAGSWSSSARKRFRVFSIEAPLAQTPSVPSQLSITMTDTVAHSACQYAGGPPMNTDISGIGVRISFYLQTIFLGELLYPSSPIFLMSNYTARVQLVCLRDQNLSTKSLGHCTPSLQQI
jgi:hypothetical protein